MCATTVECSQSGTVTSATSAGQCSQLTVLLQFMLLCNLIPLLSDALDIICFNPYKDFKYEAANTITDIYYS